MENRIKNLERRTDSFDETNARLILEVIKPMREAINQMQERIEGLEKEVAYLLENKEEKSNKRKRDTTTYETYCIVKDMEAAGTSKTAIAKEIGKQISTVNLYLGWSDEKVEEKRKEMMQRLEREQNGHD